MLTLCSMARRLTAGVLRVLALPLVVDTAPRSVSLSESLDVSPDTSSSWLADAPKIKKVTLQRRWSSIKDERLLVKSLFILWFFIHLEEYRRKMSLEINLLYKCPHTWELKSQGAPWGIHVRKKRGPNVNAKCECSPMYPILCTWHVTFSKTDSISFSFNHSKSSQCISFLM